MFKYLKRWNTWRKLNINSWFHKILVLLRLHNRQTLATTLISEDFEKDKLIGIDLSNDDDKFVFVTGRVVNGKVHFDKVLDKETLYNEMDKWNKQHSLYKAIQTKLEEE